MGEVQAPLRPGQLAILRLFAKHGFDSCFVASDPMDLRVCSAMVARGLLAQAADHPRGFDLTPAGRTALGAPER